MNSISRPIIIRDKFRELFFHLIHIDTFIRYFFLETKSRHIRYETMIFAHKTRGFQNIIFYTRDTRRPANIPRDLLSTKEIYIQRIFEKISQKNGSSNQIQLLLTIFFCFFVFCLENEWSIHGGFSQCICSQFPGTDQCKIWTKTVPGHPCGVFQYFH